MMTRISKMDKRKRRTKMVYDFSEVDEAEDYSPPPAGDYLCYVADATDEYENGQKRISRNGDEMWNIKLEIGDGDYAGRYIYDNLVFAAGKAMGRVKYVLKRLGFDISGKLDINPEDLIGRPCILTTEVEEYTSNDGKTKKRSIVPFTGYQKADNAPARQAPSKTPSDEDCPF